MTHQPKDRENDVNLRFIVTGLCLIVAGGAVYLGSLLNTPAEPRSVGQGTARLITTAPDLAANAEAAASQTTVPQTAAPETETVMGISVLKERNCTVTRHYVDLGNGTVTEAYSCVRNEEPATEYSDYSNAELAVMAYGDAKAASVLGKRLVESEPDRSRALLLRAAALEPGNVEPLAWLASQSYSLRGETDAALNAAANAYIITQTARALGSNADLDWIVEDLRKAGFEEHDITALDDFAKKDLDRVRSIQLDVFGETSIGEEAL